MAAVIQCRRKWPAPLPGARVSDFWDLCGRKAARLDSIGPAAPMRTTMHANEEGARISGARGGLAEVIAWGGCSWSEAGGSAVKSRRNAVGNWMEAMAGVAYLAAAGDRSADR
eukprot:g11155.t1